MAFYRVDGLNRRHLFASFIFAAADHPGSFHVILFKIPASFHIRRIQSNCLFKFLLYLPRIRKTAVAVCFASIDRAEPLMVDGIFRIKLDGFLTGGYRVVIIVEFVIAASEPILRLGVVRNLRHRLQRFDCSSVISQVELVLRGLNRPGRIRCPYERRFYRHCKRCDCREHSHTGEKRH